MTHLAQRSAICAFSLCQMYVMRKFACMKKYKNDIKDVQQQGFVVKVIEMC